MRCPHCQEGSLKRHRNQTYLFSESGLDNVILKGVDILECESCGEWSPVIPDISGALDAVFCALLLRPVTLSGKEIRFLRNRLRMKSKDFASKLGVDASYLSRLEKKNDVDRQLDKQVRLFVINWVLEFGTNKHLKRRLGEEIGELLELVPSRNGGTRRPDTLVNLSRLKSRGLTEFSPVYRPPSERPDQLYAVGS